MPKKLKISLGSDNFKELVTTSDIFVDKSLFIQEALDSGEKAILITRPRRWGKSLALDMLKIFLDINHDTESISLEKNPSEKIFLSSPYKTIKENVNKKLFTPLKIAQEKTQDNISYIDQYLGKYPVIHITLKDITGTSTEEVKTKIKLLLKIIFKEHGYLLKSQNIDVEDKKEYQQYIDQDYSKINLENSLKFLSKLLYEHHKQKVYILIDEYDKPVNYLLEKNLSNSNEVVQEIAHLITRMLSTCGKSNDYLEKIILTGIFDSLKKEGGSGFNNIDVYGITNVEFSQHFGFSIDEVKHLVEKLEFTKPKNILKNIKDWYNGYIVPAHGSEYIKAYTPWAVMRYLNSAYKNEEIQPESYWVQSGASTIFQTLLKTEDCADSPFINSLLNITQSGESILEYNRGVSLFKYDLNTASQDERIFSYLLLNSGYLTATNQNITHITLSIPNFEVREELKDVFNTHIKNVQNKKSDICMQIQNAFNNNLQEQKDPIVNYLRSIKEQDLGALKNTLTKISCPTQKYTIHPLNLAALSGNIEIFRATLEQCKQNTVPQNYNLTLTDYAYLSASKKIVDLVQHEYKIKPSFTKPHLNSLDDFMCKIYDVTNLALSTIGAVGGVGALWSKITGSGIPAVIQAHPYITATTLLVTGAPFVYSKFSYSNICDNYNSYNKIENVTSQHSKSLEQFLKYRLQHNDTSYVKIGDACNDNDQKVSLFTTEILSNTELSDDNQLNIVLCAGKILNELVEGF